MTAQTPKTKYKRSHLVPCGHSRAVLAAAFALALLLPAAGHARLPQQDGQIDLLTQANVRIDGESIGDQAGEAVGAGDVNGDGVDDVIVGARLADQTGPDAGSAYVVFGRPELPITIDLEFLSMRRQGFRIDGALAGDHAGASVASAGNVNGDGMDDVIVGATDGGPLNEGTAYVVFGKGGYDTVRLSDIEQEKGGGFAIVGAAALDGAGASVASAGDVNGDDLDDAIVGAPYTDVTGNESGSAYVVYGKASAAKVVLGTLGSQGFAIYGAQAGDHAGASVASAGHANDDAIPDLAVGADNASSGAGAASVIFGKHDEEPVYLAESLAGYTFRGDLADHAGAAVAPAADQNDDGKDDVLVGAPKGCPDASACEIDDDQGVSYVIYGKSDAADISAHDIETGVSPRPGFLIAYEAPARGDFQLGGAVAGTPDANDDGIADLAFGAPLDEGVPAQPRSQSGAAYAVFGQARSERDDVRLEGDFDPATGFRAAGAAQLDLAGSAVSGGDLNGDGRSDAIVGAPGADNGFADQSGSIYLVFGFGEPELRYASGTNTGFLGSFKSIRPAKYEHTGPVSFTVDPPLPAGLTIDPETGAISGAPTELDPETVHTVTMTDLVDSERSTVAIAVRDGFSFLGRRAWHAFGGGETTLMDMTVNLGLGSLLLEQDDLTLPKPGPGDFTLSRTYNSYLAHNADLSQRAKGLFGFGWASVLDKSVIEQYSGDVRYYDGQGAEFTFVRQQDDTYRSPGGLYLRMDKKRPYGTGFTVTDKRGVVESYDGQGHLTEIRDANQNTVTISWLGSSPTQIATGGQIATITTTNGLIDSIINPDGNSAAYKYNAKGELVSVTDLDGRKTLFSHDDRHKLTRTGSPALAASGGSIANDDCGDQLGEAVILYDEIGRVTSITDERHRKENGNDQVYLCDESIGLSTTYLYEPDRTKCPDPVCVTDPLRHDWLYVLDDRLRPCEVVDGSNNSTKLYYDGADTTATCPAVSEDNPANNLTGLAEYRRDGRGYLKKLTTTITYDPRGNLTAYVEPVKDGRDGTIDTRKTTLAYDAQDNMTDVTTPGGKRWRYAYAKPEKHHPGRIASLDDPKVYLSFGYDSQGNLGDVRLPLSHYTFYSYDAQGRISSADYPWGNPYSVTYGPDADREWPLTSNISPSNDDRISLRRHYLPSGRLTATFGDRNYAPLPFCNSLAYDDNGLLASTWEMASIAFYLTGYSTQRFSREANGKVSYATSSALVTFTRNLCDEYYDWGPETRSHHEINGANRVSKSWVTGYWDEQVETGIGTRHQTAYRGNGVPFEVDRCPYTGEACELHPIQIMTVDEQGNPTAINRYDENITQTSSFDYLNRETSRRVDPNGPARAWLDQTIAYDNDDNVSRIDDAAGESYDFGYTKTGWLATTRNRRTGEVTRWSYDREGSPTSA